MNSHKENLWIFLKNCSNEICSNEIGISWEPSVHSFHVQLDQKILNGLWTAGDAGGAAASPDFWRSAVNPIQTRRADYYLPSPRVFSTSYDPGAH